MDTSTQQKAMNNNNPSTLHITNDPTKSNLDDDGREKRTGNVLLKLKLFYLTFIAKLWSIYC